MNGSERKSKEQKIATILAEVLDRYNRFIQQSCKIGGYYSSSGKKAGRRKIQHFGFVPARTEYIAKILFTIYARAKVGKVCPTFLDIGCGIGNIVQIACKIGFEAHGLEYNTRIYNIAHKLIDTHECTIIKCDMFKFEQYHKYDVLYYYQPLVGCDLMREFAMKLAKEVKVGAYVIPNGTDDPFQAKRSFQCITNTHCNAPHAYRKIYRKIREM